MQRVGRDAMTPVVTLEREKRRDGSGRRLEGSAGAYASRPRQPARRAQRERRA
ncbi:MAG: hypothetical protein WCE97_10790 [Candidatus Cybelea sp.]